MPKRVDHTKQLQKIQAVAEARGGKLLSTVYTTSIAKYQFACSNPKHPPFSIRFSNVSILGTWCPRCSGKFPDPNEQIEKLKAAAAAKNGQLLTLTYTPGNRLYEFKCHNPNHPPFKSRFNSITCYGSWCPRCFADQLSITKRADPVKQMERLQQAVQARGGQLLTTTYLGSTAKYEVQCGNLKHPPFKAQYHKLATQGRWCPVCAGKIRGPE